MFKLPVGDQIFVAKIQFQQPNDRGSHTQCQFKAKFLRLSVSELQASTADGGSDLDLMRRVFIGFEDVEGTDGKPAEFNDQARDVLLDDTIILQALRDKYLAEIQGGGARRKN
jgi:hypothetical protein